MARASTIVLCWWTDAKQYHCETTNGNGCDTGRNYDEDLDGDADDDNDNRNPNRNDSKYQQ